MSRFDQLLISYAGCRKDCTSYVDWLSISDLEKSVRQAALYRMRVVNMATGRFFFADCSATSFVKNTAAGDVYVCRVTTLDTEHNTKEEVELGDLDITWLCDSGETPIKSMYKEPLEVTYLEKDGDKKDVLRPEFGYLKHYNNCPQYFLYRPYKGSVSRRESVYYEDTFRENEKKFSKDELESIYDYVKSEVEKLTEFSVATRWPAPWPKELLRIEEILGDFTEAGYFLSCLVQKAVMESPYEWSATKFRVFNRKKRTLYFYRSDKLKEVE